MRAGIRSIICVVLVLAAAQLVRAQEATSANLPDQFQTGEMIQVHKPKRKKAESTPQTVATAPQQRTVPISEQTSPAEQPPMQMPPTEEKKREPNRTTSSIPTTQEPATSVERAGFDEEAAAVVVSPTKKLRSRKRSRPVLQEAATISAPVPMSLSVAQSMAITAPLPEYPYEAKRRNLRGSGTCVVTVDTATGTVTDAAMSQTTGVPMLDKLTVQTFKSWRFKPGTVSEVRVPISYE